MQYGITPQLRESYVKNKIIISPSFYGLQDYLGQENQLLLTLLKKDYTKMFPKLENLWKQENKL